MNLNSKVDYYSKTILKLLILVIKRGESATAGCSVVVDYKAVVLEGEDSLVPRPEEF